MQGYRPPRQARRLELVETADEARGPRLTGDAFLLNSG